MQPKIKRWTLMIVEVGGELHREAALALARMFEVIPGIKAKTFHGTYSTIIVYPATAAAAERYDDLTDVLADIAYNFERAVAVAEGAVSKDIYGRERRYGSINIDVIPVADRYEDVEEFLADVPEAAQYPWIDLSE